MTSKRTISLFLLGTFGLAIISFSAMLFVPGAQSPEGWPGLPIWLLAIWSPSLTAMVIAHRNGQLKPFLSRLIAFRRAGPAAAIMLVPALVLLTLILVSGASPEWEALPVPLLLALLAFNLVLGPLGEELGWRGLLLPALEIRFGWLGAALVVGAIWAAWHAPLWLFDSPQSAIPFGAFCGHAMAYSILMAAAHRQAPGSLVPAVCLHLLFNVTVGVAVIWGVADIAEFYLKTLPLYGMAALIVAGTLSGKAGCPVPHRA